MSKSIPQISIKNVIQSVQTDVLKTIFQAFQKSLIK